MITGLTIDSKNSACVSKFQFCHTSFGLNLETTMLELKLMSSKSGYIIFFYYLEIFQIKFYFPHHAWKQKNNLLFGKSLTNSKYIDHFSWKDQFFSKNVL